MRLERITLYLTTQERQALEKAALFDMRDKRDQARFLLREELARRGFLPQTVKNNAVVIPENTQAAPA